MLHWRIIQPLQVQLCSVSVFGSLPVNPVWADFLELDQHLSWPFIPSLCFQTGLLWTWIPSWFHKEARVPSWPLIVLCLHACGFSREQGRFQPWVTESKFCGMTFSNWKRKPVPVTPSLWMPLYNCKCPRFSWQMFTSPFFFCVWFAQTVLRMLLELSEKGKMEQTSNYFKAH